MKLAVPSPSSVAVFGAGVAGLTAAHELVRLGHAVTVYETNPNAGGFFRSARMAADNGMPSEYSWHGLGPWYHNAFDIMKQIAFDETGSVYDKVLSRPLNFGIAPDKVNASFGRDDVFTSGRMFRMTRLDLVVRAWWLLKTWSANQRAEERYAWWNAADLWKPWMSSVGWKTWRSTFGPWIGSDWTRVSLHHVGQFFRRNLMSGPPHDHPADADGPAWTHGSKDGWLILRGPSSEVWFNPWVAQLERLGVRFAWRSELTRLEFADGRLSEAVVDSDERVVADHYVLAINPFMAKEVLDRTPALAEMQELCLFRGLIQDGPHTQVSFRIAFFEKIVWSETPSAVVVSDSEFNLTIFAEDQVWPEGSLGEGIQSLWTGTACAGGVPGRIHRLPIERCTKAQFIEEITAQLASCKALDFLLRESNHGRGLSDFPVARVEVWHEWIFSPDGIRPGQPKWVTTTNTQQWLPRQSTPVSNLFLAGAHTRTEADVWSIEGAVESGRRAARHIDPRVLVLPQHKAAAQLCGRRLLHAGAAAHSRRDCNWGSLRAPHRRRDVVPLIGPGVDRDGLVRPLGSCAIKALQKVFGAGAKAPLRQ
jgi:hypothetical protein